MSMDAEQTTGGESTVALVKDILGEAGALMKAEVTLAKDEIRRELADAKRSVISFGAAAMLAILAVAMLLIAWALAFFPNPLPSAIAGGVLLAGAAIASIVGYRAVPKKPLEATRARLEADVQLVKEQLS